MHITITFAKEESMRFTTFAALTIAFATMGTFNNFARAEIIHFTNPAPGEAGHYNWHYESIEGWESWLDITAPSTAQSNLVSGSSVGQLYGSSQINRTIGGAAVDRAFDAAWGGFVTSSYSAGMLINGGTFFNNFSVHALEIEPTSVITTFPEGEPLYIGVRTGKGQYGWIEVERTGLSFAAFSWAYETEPGVPIYAGQIPAPSALALLVITAFTSQSRRRRA
jgi:hypothetical protein